MATGRITKTAVDGLAAGLADQFLWDDELRGFGLKVTPGGAKSYIIQYRTGGRGTPTRRYTIGRHGVLTPNTAKLEAKRLLGLVSEGKDPAAAKRDARTMATDLAFSGFVGRFLDLYVKHEWPSSYEFAEGILRLHVTPHLKAKPLPLINRSDITRVFDALPVGKAALRRNVHAVIRRLFRWAVGRGDIDRSPMEGMEAPPSAPSRDRVLSDEELRLAWLAADTLGYPFGALYRLLIGTGQRREEVAGLNWSELDRSTATWLLPAARAKNATANHLHLSSLMIAELDRIAGGGKWPRADLVLSTNGKTSVSGFSRGKKRLDREMTNTLAKQSDAAGIKAQPLKPWRVHDFRRTFATGMQRLGIRFEVTEAILNHVSGSKSGVAGVYQRHDWKDEKRAALEAWGAHVSRMVANEDRSNVIDLTGLRA
ncbi:MAG TPA: site-specific integrase [Sphingomicrobium sp.]|nr:site-specific integrase [Sphingomicrobium sp.]